MRPRGDTGGLASGATLGKEWAPCGRRRLRERPCAARRRATIIGDFGSGKSAGKDLRIPHAVFEDPPPLEEFWRAFVPFKEVRDDGTVLEARSIFLRRDGEMALVQGFVRELAPPLHFFVLCDRRGARVTIRCEQFTPVPRTPGVVEVVTRVARQFRDLGGRVTKTNLDLG